MYILLSHKLSLRSPLFPGTPPLQIRPLKQTSKGDSSNSYVMEMATHLGTHVDSPNHFDEHGKPIASFAIEDLIFQRPVMISLPKREDELIQKDELEKNEKQISRADFLLVKTEFQKLRDSSPEKYASDNPGFSADAAKYLRGAYSGLRGLGFDFISLSSNRNRSEGREAHKALLVGRDFFIVEDMDLSLATPEIKRLFVVPLFVEGVDGTPCTVVAET